MSLGLIVTELVINALKHAFPAERSGLIAIDYRSSGNDWILSVTDDGIGMPTGDDAPKAGLGSGIVQALAKNMQGDIQMGDAGPGTVVTIRHRHDAGLGADVSAAA